MALKVDETIFEKFPGLILGIVIAEDIDNAGSGKVEELLKEQCQRVRTEYEIKPLADDPKLMAWRNAYSLFGAKPKKYKCSVENLYRMILDGVMLKPINTLVDVYNVISLKHTIPVGGDDIDKVDGDIVLKFASGNENFFQLNSEEASHPKEGEVVYVDDKEVLCRRWNWRECDKSKMTEGTKNAVLVVEGIPPVSREEIESILNEFSEMVKQYCGGEISAHILDKSTVSINF